MFPAIVYSYIAALILSATVELPIAKVRPAFTGNNPAIFILLDRGAAYRSPDWTPKATAIASSRCAGARRF